MSIKHSCSHEIKDKNYCNKCGSIAYKNFIAVKHFKYLYKTELSPIKIFEEMIKSNKTKKLTEIFPEKSFISKYYFSHRHVLKSFIKKINSHVENNSRSFFLALYYMDLIFTNENLENIFYSHFSPYDYEYGYNPKKELPKRVYFLLSLSCLIIASKFNENDPHVPNLSVFVSICANDSKGNYVFDLDTLGAAEVISLKLLNYKLQYYSLYHYVLFFFAHGLLFKTTIIRTDVFLKSGERKIIEKIYIQSREILDIIIDKKEYYNLYIGEENYITAVIILLWSIESVLDIKLNDSENIFKLIYDIKISKEKYEQIYKIISDIFPKNQLKNENYVNSIFKKSINSYTIVKKLNKNEMPKSESNYDFFNSNINNQNIININTPNTTNTSIRNSNIFPTNQPYQLQYPNNNPQLGNKISGSLIILTNDQDNNYNENNNHIIYGRNNRIYLNSKVERVSCRARVVGNSNEKIHENKSLDKLPIDSRKKICNSHILIGNNITDKLHSSCSNNNIDFCRNHKFQINNVNDENDNKIGNIEGVIFKNSKRYYISRVRRRANSTQKNVTSSNNLLSNKNFCLQLSIDTIQNGGKNLNFADKKINLNSNDNLNENPEDYNSQISLDINKNKNNNYKNINNKINKNNYANSRNIHIHFSPNNQNLKNYEILYNKFHKDDEIRKNYKLNKTLGKTNYENIINKTKNLFIDKIPEDNNKRFSTKNLYSDNFKNKYITTDKNGTIIINNNININTIIDKKKMNTDKNLKNLYDNEMENQSGKNYDTIGVVSDFLNNN